jgi:putative chitinase
MKQLTPALLAQIYAPTPLGTCALYVDYLNADFAKYEITNLNRVAAFLGQVGIESQLLTHTMENLNYRTPDRLDAMFSAVRGTDDAAALIRGGPQAIANRVYAGRLGNGDEASGDGWKFRGAGLIQLTGRANHAEFGAAIGMPVDPVPAYLQSPKGASEAACWFWAKHGLNALADGWQISNITRSVNGPAMAAAAERLALSNKAKGLLS